MMLSHRSKGATTCRIDCSNKMYDQPCRTFCRRRSSKQTIKKSHNKHSAVSAQQQQYRQYTPHSSTALLLLLTQALFLLLLLVSISPTDGNPDWMQHCSMCHCNWNSGKKTADCKARSLKAIPNDLSNEMQVVDFSNNHIPELRREEFADANLQNLHKIFLRNCTIQEVNRDALKGLTILIELDMSHNFIGELHVGTFSGLEKLRTLVMNHNEIQVLENYLFVDLPFLSRVEFKNNRLKQVEVHTFGQQPILSAIYLEANSLHVLRKETFTRIPKLVHLSLTQNPWNCTCELQAFRDFAIAKRLYTPPTDCAQPAALRGKLWTDIPSENFACQPHILGSVRSFVEVQSDNITLPCRVEGSPRPNITWVYNRRAINPNDQRFLIRNSLEQPPLISSDPIESITSELRIFNVRASDKGVYTCIAENRGGKGEAEFQLIVDGDFFGALEGIAGGVGASTTDTQSNFLLVICLIVITVLLILMCVLLLACWWCRRARSYQKDTTMMSENGLISTKMDKTNSSMLEGSVIMEMQKSLLTEVNPVEKPPRRTELENVDGSDEGHEIKKTLLDESQFGNHPRDDETHSVALSDTTAPRVRHTYIDDTYGTSLPPDLLAFPARVPPTSPSMQSSHSNIPEQIIYGIRSPPLTSPVYAHMTPHGIYGTTTIAAATPNGFMTLQHPKSRNLALIAAANNRQQLQQQQHMHAVAAHLPPQHGVHHQQQSPFMPAPVMYSPTTAVVMKQGYMTIPRKPRVPSWAPSTSTANATQLSEFQSPTSPNPSESGTATTAELQAEPVYDNLGLRTTAAGNSTLNLHKLHPEASSGTGGASTSTRYTMRDRPLPATPSLTSVASSSASTAMQQQQQQQVQQQQQTPTKQKPVLPSTSAAAVASASKIYEPIHDLAHNHHQLTTTSDTEPLYGTARNHNGLTIVPSAINMNGGVGGGGAVNGALNISNSANTSTTGGEPTKVAKIPPRPPPKPKKKMSVTAIRGGQGSTSQLFDDEGEDGTEV
uniref:Leucine-rich repeat-containing protein 24 n=1 Tax=Ceratitis capitata TaxID=7213 RepID=W8AB76_CERCA